jgi:hypothetical protein
VILTLVYLDELITLTFLLVSDVNCKITVNVPFYRTYVSLNACDFVNRFLHIEQGDTVSGLIVDAYNFYDLGLARMQSIYSTHIFPIRCV